MIRASSTKINKIWSKLALSTRNGANKNFQMIKVPEERFDEYVDFTLKYYVQNEITHKIAGISKCKDAMKEYRSILINNFSQPNVENSICCVDNDGKCGRIAGMSSIKLITLDDFAKSDGYVPATIKTEPVKRFYKILNEWNNLFPVPELMERLGIDRFFDDCGAATHPEYIGFGIATEVGILRQMICKEYGVSATGAWMTAVGTQVATARSGWQTVFEISYEELGKRLDLDFKNLTHTCKYMMRKV